MMLASIYSRASSQETFGKYNDALDAPSTDQLLIIQGVLNGTIGPGYQFHFTLPANTRFYVINHDDWGRVGDDDSGNGPPAGGSGAGTDATGAPEVALDPGVIDPDNPGRLAEVLDHEAGHKENEANGVDTGDETEAGRAAHFAIYAATLPSLCAYICNLCFNFEPWDDVDLLCIQYANGAEIANCYLRPPSTPMIPYCECCPCDH